MIGSVLIQYSVKSLNKVFDYLIPDTLKDKIKVGNKVLVPFGKSNVEGFVLKIHNNIEENIDYKEITSIIESDFYLNEELLKLGKYMSDYLLCNLISCYQIMLPKALKASIKTNINKKTETKVSLNNDVDIDTYILEHKRNKKEIELLNYLKDKEEIKSKINCPSLKKLIDNGIVLETVYEVNRNVDFEEEKDRKIVLNDEQKNAIKEILNSKDNKFLIYGVTGSGKTEIYIDLIRNMIKEGKSSIVLVPEISLTPQIVSRFKNVFGDSVAVFHSSLSEG